MPNVFSKILNRVANLLNITSPYQYPRAQPLNTTVGVPDAQITTHSLHTDDGIEIRITRFFRENTKTPVVVFHGLTTSCDMYIMPEHENLVKWGLDNDWKDVWVCDNRISRRFPYNLEVNDWSLDDVALYDNPLLLDYIVKAVDAEMNGQMERPRHSYGSDIKPHVIAHCVNSMTVLMSLSAGKLPKLSSLSCNSASITPVLPSYLAVAKLTILTPIARTLFQFISPYMIRDRHTLSPSRIMAAFISLFHYECDVYECHMVGFMWSVGSGVWKHENLLQVSHERAADLYGGSNLVYHGHIAKSVWSGHIKRAKEGGAYDTLPTDYFVALAESKGLVDRLIMMSGSENGVFGRSADNLVRELKKTGYADNVIYKEYPNYGHQDVFMGANVAKDIFPSLDLLMRGKSGSPKVRVGGES